MIDDIPAVVLCNFLGKYSRSLPQNFPTVFLPICKSKHSTRNFIKDSHVPRVDILLDHIISFLSANGIKKIMLFCTDFGDIVEGYISSRYRGLTNIKDCGQIQKMHSRSILVHQSLSKHSTSLGDALREIYITPALNSWLFSGKGKSDGMNRESSVHDFLLIEGETVVYRYTSLRQEIEKHVFERKKNPQLLCSILGSKLAQERAKESRSRANSLAFECSSSSKHHLNNQPIPECSTAILLGEANFLFGKFSTSKLIKTRAAYVNNRSSHSQTCSNSTEFSSLYINAGKQILENIKSWSRLQGVDHSVHHTSIVSQISTTGITICSSNILAVMKENFDFTSIEDCITAYTFLNDFNIGNNESDYENEEMNRLINHYDLRMPIIEIVDNLQKLPVSFLTLREIFDVHRMMICPIHPPYILKDTKNECCMSVERLKHVYEIVESKIAERNSGESTNQCIQGTNWKTFLFQYLDDIHVNQQDCGMQLHSTSPTKFALKSRFSEFDISETHIQSSHIEHSTEVRDVVDDYRKLLQNPCNHERSTLSDTPKSKKAGAVSKKDDESAGIDTIQRVFNEISDLIESSITSVFLDRSKATTSCEYAEWTGFQEKSTNIDSLYLILSCFSFEENDLRVSLSQLRFIHNQTPMQFGCAFLIAIFQMTLKVSASYVKGSEDTLKNAKCTQKIFQHFIAMYAKLLNEERFGSSDIFIDEETSLYHCNERIMLLLMESIQLPQISARFPHFLKILYEEAVVSEDEIFGIDDLIHSKTPISETIYRLTSKYPYIQGNPLSADTMYNMWEKCEPLIAVLKESE